MDPVTMMILGAVIAAVSIIFAVVNMARGVSTMFRSQPGTDPFSSFMGMFSRHALSGVGVVLGGLLFLIGLILQLT